jgi:hypothetical protein
MYTIHKGMKKYILAIIILIFCILSEYTRAIENPSVRNPVISSSVPPSSVSRSLIPTPNPINDAGNLVITGNVTAGKHFRGSIPYSSPTSFEAGLGSSSLDSFLRYSALEPTGSSVNFNRQPWDNTGTYYKTTGQYRPFYSPTGTVATLQTGQQKPVNGFVELKRSNAADNSLDMVALLKTPQEMDKLIYNELGTSLPQIENPRQLGNTSARTGQYTLPSMSNITGESGMMQNVSAGTAGGTRDEQQLAGSAWPAGIKGFESNVGMYPSNIKDIDRLIAQIETRTKTQDSSSTTGTAMDTDVIKTSNASFGPPSVSTRENVAQAPPGYNTRDKFDWYMQAAQLYLKQGRFYRAADSYTIASVYKPDMPSGGLAYAGKSQALFAAGEYMTSALFLSKALEFLPEYARLKVDLVGILGDKDKFTGRVAEVEDRFKVSGAPELEFLLGYINYQSFLRDGAVPDELDRLDAAKRLLDAASQKLPGSKAVETLKNVVGETSYTK